MSELLVYPTNHVERINNHVNWLFRTKKAFVILRQFKGTDVKLGNTVKMFMVIPTSQRTYTSDKKDIFDPNVLFKDDIDFIPKDILLYKTLYTGNIEEFKDIKLLLNSFNYEKPVHNIGTGYFYQRTETTTAFRDYTKTKAEQLVTLTQGNMCFNPHQSIDSVYRLLHTKFVTVVDITFNNNNNRFDNGNNSL